MNLFVKEQIRVIVTILVALVIAFWGYNFLRGYDMFSSARTYRFRVDEVPPSIKSASILYKGVQIGRVSAVRILEDDRVEVDMEIERELQVTEGSSVEMVFSGFFGEVNIQLLKKEGGMSLADNSILHSQTVPYAGFEEITKHIESTLKPIPVLIEKLSDVAHVIQKQGEQVDIRNINRILKNIDSLSHYMSIIVADQSDNGITHNLNDLISRVKEIPTEGRMKRIDSLTIDVQNLIKVSSSVFRRMDTVSVHLNRTVERMSKEEGYLRSVLLDKQSNHRLDSLMVQINQFLERINKQPGRYLKEINLIKVF